MKIEEKEWQKLCRLVADEPDPARLSKLVEQLISELDALRKELNRPHTRVTSEEQDVL